MVIFKDINVDYEEQDDEVILSGPDYGDGATVISMPFIQLEVIYKAILNKKTIMVHE